MAIQLSKGQRVDLTKTNPGLTKAVIGLGWDTNKYSGGHDFDLDASAFLVDAHDNCVNDLDFVSTITWNTQAGASSIRETTGRARARRR